MVGVYPQAIGVYAGSNLLPASHLSLEYFHPSNYPLFLSAQVFVENSRSNSLRYNAAGLGIHINYASSDASSELAALRYRAGLGLYVQEAREAWLLRADKNNSALHTGATMELAGELTLSSAFSFSVFTKARWLLDAPSFSRQLVLGAGLVYKLSD